MRTALMIPCLVLAVILLTAAPATATLVLSDTLFSPPALPLTRGEDLRVDAGIAIIPSGADTFATGHSLQIETGLADARWNTGVVVDGIPAAQQSGTGRVIHLNGYVLSYPTNRDVALDITVEGTVPEDASPDLMVLSVKELDNGGAAVPGNRITVTEPVGAPVATLPPSPMSTPVSPPPPASPVPPVPTKADGMGWLAGLLAVGAFIGLRSAR